MGRVGEERERGGLGEGLKEGVMLGEGGGSDGDDSRGGGGCFGGGDEGDC